MTKAGMPESVRIAWKHNPLRGDLPEIWFIQQSQKELNDERKNTLHGLKVPLSRETKIFYVRLLSVLVGQN